MLAPLVKSRVLADTGRLEFVVLGAKSKAMRETGMNALQPELLARIQTERHAC